MENFKIIFIILTCSIFFSNCGDKDSDYVDVRGTDYAGAESCIQCHQTMHHSYLQTAHFKATAPATLENVMGHFSAGKNTFVYDANTKLVMEKRGDSLYQVLYKNQKEVKAYPFDILFGSHHAQTAVFWKNSNTFELPISYYKSVDDWATSPGFSTTQPYFERQAIKDCYACHASSVSNKAKNRRSDQMNSYTMEVEDIMNKKTIIYGIDCERCHGPAKAHVDHHIKFPEEKFAQKIIKFRSLTNQQKFDACAICHSGANGIKIKSRFEFKPGDNLNEFYRTISGNDVHGNQAGLLAQSKCFIQSGAMNCVTCHNPHENASKNLVVYSKVCIACHTPPKHSPPTLQKIALQKLENNCIECHMPEQSSKVIKFRRSKSILDSEYNLRTHKIAVY